MSVYRESARLPSGAVNDIAHVQDDVRPMEALVRPLVERTPETIRAEGALRDPTLLARAAPEDEGWRAATLRLDAPEARSEARPAPLAEAC